MASVRGQFEELRGEGREGGVCAVSALLHSAFFYETAAELGSGVRLARFYASLHAGDRFVAKVVSVLGRCADVVLVWSPRRAIADLGVKASLRLVQRYASSSGPGRSRASSERCVEVSELLPAQLVSFDCRTRLIELVPCHSLQCEADCEDEWVGEWACGGRDRSRPEHSFHQYMLAHSDLANPALLKTPLFSSLLHRATLRSCRPPPRQPQPPPAPDSADRPAHRGRVSPVRGSGAKRVGAGGSRSWESGTERGGCKTASTLTLSDHSTSSGRRRRKHRKPKSHRHRRDKKHRKKKSKKHKKKKRHKECPSAQAHSKHNLDDKILKWLNQM